jgi:hypothetical protein
MAAIFRDQELTLKCSRVAHHVQCPFQDRRSSYQLYIVSVSHPGSRHACQRNSAGKENSRLNGRKN